MGPPSPKTLEDANAKLPGILHPVRFFRRLSTEHSGAGELAAAVWVGIFLLWFYRGRRPDLEAGKARRERFH